MHKVDFVFFDAGGGHRSAANALKAVAEQQQRPWDVRLMNLQEELDSLDVFKKITRIRLQDIYNRMLAKGWTFGSEFLLPLMHGIIRLYHPAQVRMLTGLWSQRTPDLIVSVVPNFNRALFQSLQRYNPQIPYVTILTDFADYPPHFWLEKQDQYVICGTERAHKQAIDKGIRPDKAFLVSGMILRPAFYHCFTHDRAEERKKLGLDPGRTTALILFGGHGSTVMSQITRNLQSSGRDLQLILICGRNEKLAAEIKKIRTKIPMHVVGFTSDIPYYMSLADFFIGKPGPGSISEALAMKLPVIVEKNAWTLPQERYNAEWIREKKVGLVLDSFETIRTAVDELLEEERFREMRAKAASLGNRAVFEITEILGQILDRRA